MLIRVEKMLQLVRKVENDSTNAEEFVLSFKKLSNLFTILASILR